MQRRLTLLSAAVLTLTLVACASAPTRFYTLAGPTPDTQTPPARPAASATLSVISNAPRQTYIEVLPVSVPERLARPQIVVRTDDTRVDILEQDRWSAPFNNELRDALASGVANRLGAVDVTRGGRPAGRPVYRIVVELRQLDAMKGGKVDAAFGWTITRSDDNSSAVCRLTVLEPAPGVGVDGVVQGMQRAVANVANAIAADVAALREGKTGVCSS
ncbi:membrane integrity-associated transporter subunit PqiC [Herbaspirillum sp. RV1423]|uniref:PqiC family protein n=1 Tax=Herbaspirillum sp. RV1423 TaxID=1443993 RepID=UPI0004B9CAD0|nr:PqiC family protein [Herbaspirillum sp. RV1423]